MKKYFFSILFLLLSACSEKSSQEGASDVGKNIGWMHGNCLAINNADISLPHKITVVLLEETNLIAEGTVTKKAQSEEGCYALMEDRKEVNLTSGYSFYEVELESPVELAIAYLDVASPTEIEFTYCTTSEGVKYSAKKEGKVIWEGYYYLGYDSEATCEE